MGIIVSKSIIKKLLEKHGVTEKEVVECLNNRTRSLLEDTREDHKTDPPTKWIVSRTNHFRELKIIFIITNDDVKGANVVIKSAYEPTQEVLDIYERYSKPL